MSDPRPIGVFDSGVGGLTVLREILRRLPGESTIYLGDNARAPYGPRPDDEVLAFSRQAIELLAERDVKAIVIACNTSTAIALADLRRRHDLPILGVIRPGAVTVALSTRNRRVGVIATSATVRSHAYFQAIKEENPAIEVYEHATPALVPLVEAGRLRGAEVEAIVRESLDGLLGERSADGTPRRAAAGLGRDRHPAPRLHPLPPDRGRDPGRDRRPDRPRRFGDRHGRRARATSSRSTASRRPARAGARPPTRAAPATIARHRPPGRPPIAS